MRFTARDGVMSSRIRAIGFLSVARGAGATVIFWPASMYAFSDRSDVTQPGPITL